MKVRRVVSLDNNKEPKFNISEAKYTELLLNVGYTNIVEDTSGVPYLIKVATNWSQLAEEIEYLVSEGIDLNSILDRNKMFRDTSIFSCLVNLNTGKEFKHFYDKSEFVKHYFGSYNPDFLEGRLYTFG